MVADRVRVVACLLLVVVLLGPVPGSAAVGDGPAADEAGDPAPSLVRLQTAPETDTTVTRIVVHANGSATWTLQVRTRLETDESESEYRAFQDRFRENTSRYRDDFRESITGIVGGAREVTGREMEAAGFRASTSIQSLPRRWGVVTFEFRWDGFAAVEGDRLLVGDVFEGGLFIAEGDSLEVVAPEGYRIASVEPSPDESDGGVATWRGREDFADGRPQVVLAPAESPRAGSLPWLPVAGGAALLGVAVLSAVGYRRLRRVPGDGSDGTSVGGRGASAVASGDEVVMADEDYVLEALAEHDGRMRQQAIAEELGWSRSKTSRVLGRMAEEDQVRKLQLGRENVIALPEDGDAVEE